MIIEAYKLASRALSLKQPWAWLCAHGLKDFENRKWWGSFTGPCLIHASKEFDPAYQAIRLMVQKQFRIELPPTVVLNSWAGGIVGIFRLGPATRDGRRPWFFGPVGWPVLAASPLPFTPCKGALNFWRVPEDLRINRLDRWGPPQVIESHPKRIVPVYFDE